MSGGRFNYLNESIGQEMQGRWYDPVLNEMFDELFCNPTYGNRSGGVAQVLDYWLSGDVSEETYRKFALQFKEKWLGNPNAAQDATKRYIDKHIEHLREQLYKECGIECEGGKR